MHNCILLWDVYVRNNHNKHLTHNQKKFSNGMATNSSSGHFFSNLYGFQYSKILYKPGIMQSCERVEHMIGCFLRIKIKHAIQCYSNYT